MKIYTLVIVDSELHIAGISSWLTMAAAQAELKADFERTIDDFENQDVDVNIQELNDDNYYIAYGGDEELYAEIREHEVENPVVSPEVIKKAEQVLIDNGIDEDEAEVVLQALGYVLLDEELYPEN